MRFLINDKEVTAREYVKAKFPSGEKVPDTIQEAVDREVFLEEQETNGEPVPEGQAKKEETSTKGVNDNDR